MESGSLSYSTDHLPNQVKKHNDRLRQEATLEILKHRQDVHEDCVQTVQFLRDVRAEGQAELINIAETGDADRLNIQTETILTISETEDEKDEFIAKQIQEMEKYKSEFEKLKENQEKEYKIAIEDEEKLARELGMSLEEFYRQKEQQIKIESEVEIQRINKTQEDVITKIKLDREVHVQKVDDSIQKARDELEEFRKQERLRQEQIIQDAKEERQRQSLMSRIGFNLPSMSHKKENASKFHHDDTQPPHLKSTDDLNEIP